MNALPLPHVEAAGIAHVPVIAALHRDSFPHEPWSERAIGEILGMPGSFARIALCAGAPAGFLIGLIVAPEAELLSVGVGAAWRRQGIGTLLLTDFLAVACRASAETAILEVAADNAPALALYESHEFHLVGERRDYYRRTANTRANALILRAALT